MSRSRLVSASLWSMTGNGAQFTTVFLLLVYLAHILTPRDFGLMATVSVGLDLGTRIARLGQIELLQQERYSDDAARNQSLRLSLLLSLPFALAFLALAGPLARHYAAPELAQMLWLCAPVFLFSAAGSTAEAVLRREYKFKQLAFRSTVATLVGAAVAIVLANHGYGALALAAQRLVQAAVSGIWVWSAVSWRPSWQLRSHWSLALAREGWSLMIGTLLPVSVPRIIDLLVGLFLGPAMLGLMRVAFRINDFIGQMVVMPLVSVANAELSDAVHDRERMRRSYLRLTQASAILMCPALIGLSLVAPEAIPFLFGHQWGGAVPFVQILGILALVAPINYYFAPAMIAVDQSRLVMRQGIWQFGLGLLLTLIGAQISLLAIAAAHVARGVIVSALNIRDLKRHMDLTPVALGRSLAVPYLATLVMALLILGARLSFAAQLPPHLRLAVLIVVGGLGYAVALRLIAHAGFWPDYALLSRQVRTVVAKLKPVRSA